MVFSLFRQGVHLREAQHSGKGGVQNPGGSLDREREREVHPSGFSPPAAQRPCPPVLRGCAPRLDRWTCPCKHVAQESGHQAGLLSSQSLRRGWRQRCVRGEDFFPRTQGFSPDHRLFFSLNRFFSFGGSTLPLTTSQTAGIAYFITTGKNITRLNFCFSINSRSTVFLLKRVYPLSSVYTQWGHVGECLYIFNSGSPFSVFQYLHFFSAPLPECRAWDCPLHQGTSGTQPRA